MCPLTWLTILPQTRCGGSQTYLNLDKFLEIAGGLYHAKKYRQGSLTKAAEKGHEDQP